MEENNIAHRSFKISLIASVDSNNFGIGYNNNLLYSSSEDLKRFRKVTTTTIDSSKKNAILMGRKTYESIGKKLPGRINIVLSNTLLNNDLNISKSPEEAEKYCENLGIIETLFVVGGQSLYEYYISNNKYDYIDLTIFTSDIKQPIDSFFPRFNYDIHRINESASVLLEGGVKMKHVTFNRITNMEEEKYLQLLKDIYTRL